MPSYFCSSPEVKKTTPTGTRGKSRQRLAMALSGFFIVIVLVYIVQINILATSGFTLKSLEKEANKLVDIQEELQIKASSIKEQTTDKQTAEEMGLVAVDKAEYLGTIESGSGVAVRQ